MSALPDPPAHDKARPPSLTVRTAKGAGWIIGWRMTTRILGLVNTLVLVRLLPPTDFGLVALATSFSQAVNSLSVIGVEQALIRETNVGTALYDAGFTMNLARSAFVALLIAGVATPVAVFYGDIRLMPIMQCLAVAMLLTGLENVRVVEFERELTYDKQFRILVPPRIAGIIAAICYGVVYRDYWALVVGILTTRASRLILTYVVLPWRPRMTLRGWSRILHFSFWTWSTAMVQTARDRLDALVIGRMLGPTSVGIYSVGDEIGSLSSSELVAPLTTALFAGFSAARRTDRNVADGYFRALSTTLLLTLPLCFGLSLLAAPVVQVTLGQKWIATVWLVRIFALLSVARMITGFSSVLFSAHAILTVQFRIMMASLLVRAGLLIALIHPYGLVGAAIAAVGCVAVEETLYLIVTFRKFGLHPWALLSSTWRCVLATAAMTIVLVSEGVGWAPPTTNMWDAWETLALGICSGAAAYIVALLLAWWCAGRPAGAESYTLDVIRQLVRQLGKRRSPAR